MAIRSELIAALILAGCSDDQPDRAAQAAAPVPAITPMSSPEPNARAVAAKTREALLLAQMPEGIRREGDTLFVRTAKGEARFRTENCEPNDDRCVSYHLDHLWDGGAFVGMLIGFWEGSDYLVLNRAGFSTTTGDRPLLSPRRRWFASAVYNEAYESSREGVRIYDAATMEEVRAVAPTTLAYPDQLAWRGDDCLSFTAARPGASRARARWWLVVASPEWHLTTSRPAACR
jgi:hypothetical protein